MRNADAINVISAKIAARLSELAGIHITPLTAEQITQDDFVPYFRALSTPGAAPTGYHTYAALEEGSVWRAIERASLYVRESARDLATVEPPAPDTDSAHEIPGEDQISAEEWQRRIEDWYLVQIPAAYRPQRPNGPADDAQRLTAEADLGMAYQDPTQIRTTDRASADLRASMHAPAGFVPSSSNPKTALAERALAGWARLHSSRDCLVLAAYNAGSTKSRIHELTGLSRVTIDRILDE